MLGVKVRSARGRKTSSTRWLNRQLNDPFVAKAQDEGYRSRAVYKLLEMDERFRLLKKGAVVLDLGAAPGSWCQVAAEKVGKNGTVIGVDIQEVEPIDNVTLFVGDILEDATHERIQQLVGEQAVDVVMSDMAAASMGHHQTDHLRIMALCEMALEVGLLHLKPGGAFLAKVLQGGAEKNLLDTLKAHFKTVKHIKPSASRKDSTEMYVVALDRKELP